jgi:hypothetical protein
MEKSTMKKGKKHKEYVARIKIEIMRRRVEEIR